MKLQSASLFLLATAGLVNGFRDQTNKKIEDPSRRRLDEDPDCPSGEYTINHDTAQSTEEITVKLETWPGGYSFIRKDGKRRFIPHGNGLFKMTLSDEPWASAENPLSTFGWCIDFDRPIDKGDWSMDIFSAYDKDIHPTAVDKPEMFPNLAFLINNVNVGDTWPAYDDGTPGGCPETEIRLLEIQGAIWKLIDDNDGTGTFYGDNRIDCVSKGIAAYARAMGNDYTLDCTDPDEQVPLVFVTDNSQGIVMNQTIISETNIHTIPGFCECDNSFPAPPKDTPAPEPEPSPSVDEPEPEPTVCTADLKECPDGSFVSRLPPKCEFAECVTDKTAPTPAPDKGSGSGDPHFKTWTGTKYDYHGECDLVLVDHPTFADGLGLKLHIRTTRVKYFSYIERAALQIGNDILEFDNDVENFLINGAKVEANHKHHKTMLGDYVIRRDPKAISIRLADGTGKHQKTGAAKIDFIHRKNGFPAVVVNGGATNIFEGSLGLLGDWSTGQTMARDGKTLIPVSKHEATEFALEWQVRDDEPMLFQDARFPQYPATCTPPAKMPQGRLGASLLQKEAEEACAHWEEDQEDCIFDVIATRNVHVAKEGHHSAAVIDA